MTRIVFPVCKGSIGRREINLRRGHSRKVDDYRILEPVSSRAVIPIRLGSCCQLLPKHLNQRALHKAAGLEEYASTKATVALRQAVLVLRGGFRSVDGAGGAAGRVSSAAERADFRFCSQPWGTVA